MTAVHAALRALAWAAIVAAVVVLGRGGPAFIYQGF